MKKFILSVTISIVLTSCQRERASEQVNASFQDDSLAIGQLYDNAFSKSKDCFDLKEGCNEAISLFDVVIGLDSTYHKAFYNRGICKMTLTDYKGALDDFTDATKLNPDDGDYFFNKGYVEVHLNMMNAACEDFRISLKKGINDAQNAIDQVCNEKTN